MPRRQWLFGAAAAIVVLAAALLLVNDVWAYRLSTLAFGLVLAGWVVCLLESEQD